MARVSGSLNMSMLIRRSIVLDCYSVYTPLCDFYPLRVEDGLVKMPLWTDVTVEIQAGRPDYATGDRITSMESHPPQQWQGYVNPYHYQHYKMLCPWFVRSSEYFLSAFGPSSSILSWADQITIPPGHIDFVHQNALHVNAFYHMDGRGNHSSFIPAGVDIIQLQPLTSSPIKICTHCVTMDEYNRLQYTAKFSGLHRERASIAEKACPFA